MKPFVIAAGGFNSCSKALELMESQSMYEHSKELRNIFGKSFERDIDVIVSCFKTNRDKIYWYSTIDRPEDKAFSFKSGSKNQYFNDVKAQIDGDDQRVAWMFGHSWGGWLAMNTALEIPAVTEIKGLVTLDPISPMNCESSSFLGGLLLGVPKKGCTEAPSDMKDHGEKIAERTGRWAQYYQTQATYVHSGVIKSADINQVVRYQGADGRDFAAHQMVDDDQNIWTLEADVAVDTMLKTRDQ